MVDLHLVLLRDGLYIYIDLHKKTIQGYGVILLLIY